MTEHKNNCLICGGELVYSDALQARLCHFCGQDAESQAACSDGHFVCDRCMVRNIISWCRLCC